MSITHRKAFSFITCTNPWRIGVSKPTWGPVTLQERMMHIQEAKRTLGTDMDWLSDSMTNDLKHAIGDASNSEFVLDPEGRIVRMRLWSDPEVLREDLVALVGPVDNPTSIADLDMEVAPPPEEAPTGVVERIELDSDFHPLVARPELSKTKTPFYVKLRAAAENELLRTGKGELYVGFFLDPIYQVHWNNEVAPVQYQIDVPEGMSISPDRAQGPTPEVPSDADPREFVLEVDRGTSTEPVRMTFNYYACTEIWCNPVRQEYLISWDIDRDSGTQFDVVRSVRGR